MAAFELHNVALGYAGRAAVSYLNGTFGAGSLSAIVGPNGSGKSTVLKGLAGLLKPFYGEITLYDIEQRGVAYLPQVGELDLSFPATVNDLASMGLWKKRGLFKPHTSADQQAIVLALTRVGLQDFGQKQINTLSGGQLQRVLFARLILQDTQAILLDEPFTAIDESTTEDLMALIAEWHQQGRTVLAVLHDFEFVKRYFPQTLLLAKRPVAWGATADVLSAVNLSNAQKMMQAEVEAA